MNIFQRVLGSKDTLNNEDYTPYKVAQRLIAISIVFVYVLSWVCALCLFIIGYWSVEAVKVAENVAINNNETLSIPTYLILSFYFAGGAAEGVIKKFQSRKDIKKPPQ